MSQTAVGGLRRMTPYLARISGGLLVLVGAYVGWYGYYELRVYAGNAADDPIISAASEIQDRLARWVDQLGPLAFTVALVVLLVVAIAARVLSARRRSRATSTPALSRPE